jgi:non-heme chloroperoxidase
MGAQVAPIGVSTLVSTNLIKSLPLKSYQRGSHGLCSTPKDQVNEAVLAVFKA